MGVETHELSHGTGVVLTCNTTDRAFGPIFRADVDVVEEFLKWLSATSVEDARQLDADGTLGTKFEEFRAAYVCASCPDEKPEEGHMVRDRVFCLDCGRYFCGQHEGEEWTDGPTEYGHDC